MKVLIDIPNIEDFDYFKQTHICRANMCRAIKNGIVLDGLENGEMFHKTFPEWRYVGENTHTIYLSYEGDDGITCELLAISLDWWNRKWGEQHENT